MTQTQSRIRDALLLAVALFVLLEGTRYLATGLWRQQFEVFPQVGVRATGETVFWTSRQRTDDAGHVTYESNVYDAARTPTEWTASVPPALAACVATAWLGQPQMEDSPLYRSGSYGPPWMPLTRWSVARRSQAAPWVGSTVPIPYSLSASFGNSYGGWTWTLEAGRLVRRSPDREVVGGFGPDGWRAGKDGLAGATFGLPWTVGSFHSRDAEKEEDHATVVLADAGLRSLFFVRTTTPRNFRGGAPGPISVDRAALTGEGELRPLQGYAASQGSIAVAIGPEIVTFAVDGRELGRVRMDAGEAPLATFAGAWPVSSRTADGRPPVVVATLPGPVPVLGARVRFRAFSGDGPPVVTDAALEPVTGAEHAVAWLRRSVAIVRPPVLSLASFAAPAPATYEEMFSAWLLDPLYAGRSEPIPLALCLGLGAVCAVAARRRAKLLRPAARDVALWTAVGAALGPVGFVWMRLVVPEQAVRPCACGARRGVNVERCPACASAWPAPARTGAEVFAMPLVSAADA